MYNWTHRVFVLVGRWAEKEGEKGSISSTFLPVVFMPVAPVSIRTQSSRQYLFTLLGYVCVKAVLRTLIKLSLGEKKKKLKQVRSRK